MKNVLLTFDVEEFDLIKDQYSLSYKGLKEILKLINKYNLKCTFFVTANFAQKYPKIIKDISKKHEIGLHGLAHKDNYPALSQKESYKKLKKGKEKIEKIINKKIIGFRAPRFYPPSYEVLKKLKLKYDSSINPIYLPRYYNNFFKKRKLHKINDLVVIPISAIPVLRLPLAWIFFKNLGLIYSKLCTKLCLLDQKHITLIFHPWEFINLHKFNLPFLIKRRTGKKLIDLLENYILWCMRKNFKFLTIKDFIKNDL